MAAILQEPKSILLSLFGIYITYLLTSSLILWYRRRIFKQSRGCLPERRHPHQKDTIFGSDFFLENIRVAKAGGFLEMLQERYKVVGAYTWSYRMPGARFILTAEPENVKAILATQFKDFSLPYLRKSAFAPIFGHGIFTTDGSEWESSRALLRPNFNRAQVADLDTLETHVQRVIDRIPKDGSTVDLQHLFFMFTLDTSTEFLFGHSTNSLAEGGSHERGLKFSQAFTDAVVQTGLIARVPPRFSFLMKNKKFDEDVKFIHEYVGEYVQKAVDMAKDGSEKSKKYVFLEELAETGRGKKKIQDELLNILLAGRDTTAALLSYLFYQLARHQKVFKKLQAEVNELNGKRPTYEIVKGMKYLQWTLNEALRLFPIVAINAREVVRDTTLPVGGGIDGKAPVFVKKGQLINYHSYVMHRRKDLYGEDAEEFKPERWETLRPGWAYLPFNGGPRICIGQQYALMEASYATIRLLQNFTAIEPRDPAPFKELLSVTVSVRGGVQVALTPK